MNERSEFEWIIFLGSDYLILNRIMVSNLVKRRQSYDFCWYLTIQFRYQIEQSNNFSYRWLIIERNRTFEKMAGVEYSNCVFVFATFACCWVASHQLYDTFTFKRHSSLTEMWSTEITVHRHKVAANRNHQQRTVLQRHVWILHWQPKQCDPIKDRKDIKQKRLKIRFDYPGIKSTSNKKNCYNFEVFLQFLYFDFSGNIEKYKQKWFSLANEDKQALYVLLS